MAVFIVTTEEDLEQGAGWDWDGHDVLIFENHVAAAEADGFVTLREAAELAYRNDWINYTLLLRGEDASREPIHDEIRFAPGIETVRLNGTMRSVWPSSEEVPINAPIRNTNLRGAGLTIDGDVDGDGLGDVTIDGQGQTSHFTVVQDMTLRNLTLANGLNDQNIELRKPVANGLDGESAGGSIRNRATLTLERVGFENNVARGMDGADGIRGEDGVNGWGAGWGPGGTPIPAASGRNVRIENAYDLNPFNNVLLASTPGLPGAHGTDGTDGGDGGRGGHAAGAILNEGELILRDVWFAGDNFARAGDGGEVGLGGRGGSGQPGGAGGRGNIVEDPTGSPGGRGGDAGSGGRSGLPGAGGDAAHLIFHAEGASLTTEGRVAVGALAEGEAAIGGWPTTGGAGPGVPGDGGQGGLSFIGRAAAGAKGGYRKNGAPTNDPDVYAPQNPFEERPGEHEAVLYVERGVEAPAAFERVSELVLAGLADDVAQEDAPLRFVLRRMGDLEAATEVDWALSGRGRWQFSADQRQGTVRLEAGADEEMVTLTRPFDGRDDGEMTVGIRILEVRAGGEAAVAEERVEAMLIDGPGDGDDVLRGTRRADDLAAGRGDDVIRGLGGGDRLAGEGGSDRLLGQGGRDHLDGGGGRDRLKGGGGADMLDGGRARDVLVGGGGRDVLDGGRGRDLLKGGAGRDAFHFDQGDGRDVIEDFGGRDVVVFNSGAERFADLRIRDRGDDALVIHQGGRILVEDAAGGLDRGDFQFA